MNSRYYISHKARINDHHSVHRDCCPFMPDDGEKTYLGSFDDPTEAVKSGKKYYKLASRCPFCCKEQTAAFSNGHLFPVRNIREIVKERIQAHEARLTGLLCSVN